MVDHFGHFYTIGGQHTATAITELIDEVEKGYHEHLKEVPSKWLEWPASTYFFPDALENHMTALLALGNVDNINVQRHRLLFWIVSSTFERCSSTFGSFELYDENKKSKKKEVRARYNKFNEDAKIVSWVIFATLWPSLKSFGTFKSASFAMNTEI